MRFEKGVKMKYSKFACIGLVAVGVFAAGGVQAGTITINVVNPSFETLPVGGLGIPCGPPGPNAYTCAFADSVVPGWTQSEIYYPPTQSYSGQFKPGVPTVTTYFNSVPDGNIVVRALNATISQTVTAVADPGATYTLNVDLGFSKKVADDGRIYLDVNGKEVEGTPTAPVVQESGNWVDYTASYTATAADSGGPIGIILWSLGRGPQGFFDNVRLTEVTPQSPSVPEPATWATMLIGFSGLRGPRSLATARCGAASQRQCLPLELVRPTS